MIAKFHIHYQPTSPQSLLFRLAEVVILLNLLRYFCTSWALHLKVRTFPQSSTNMSCCCKTNASVKRVMYLSEHSFFSLVLQIGKFSYSKLYILINSGSFNFFRWFTHKIAKYHFKIHSKLIQQTVFIWRCSSDDPYICANYDRQRFHVKFI